MSALLDVNVLVALFEPAHPHHDAAHEGFERHRTAGWATCPLTEAGFLRVVTNPTFRRDPVPRSLALASLAKLCSSPDHEFWPDDVSFRDPSLFEPLLPLGHQQLTDVYLLALAVRREGSLITFDRSIPLGAVVGARPEHLRRLRA